MTKPKKKRVKKELNWIWICPTCGSKAGEMVFDGSVKVKVLPKK